MDRFAEVIWYFFKTLHIPRIYVRPNENSWAAAVSCRTTDANSWSAGRSAGFGIRLVRSVCAHYYRQRTYRAWNQVCVGRIIGNPADFLCGKCHFDHAFIHSFIGEIAGGNLLYQNLHCLAYTHPYCALAILAFSQRSSFCKEPHTVPSCVCLAGWTPRF